MLPETTPPNEKPQPTAATLGWTIDEYLSSFSKLVFYRDQHHSQAQEV
jgi:hypothetical protein